MMVMIYFDDDETQGGKKPRGKKLRVLKLLTTSLKGRFILPFDQWQTLNLRN